MENAQMTTIKQIVIQAWRILLNTESNQGKLWIWSIITNWINISHFISATSCSDKWWVQFNSKHVPWGRSPSMSCLYRVLTKQSTPDDRYVSAIVFPITPEFHFNMRYAHVPSGQLFDSNFVIGFSCNLFGRHSVFQSILLFCYYCYALFYIKG